MSEVQTRNAAIDAFLFRPFDVLEISICWILIYMSILNLLLCIALLPRLLKYLTEVSHLDVLSVDDWLTTFLKFIYNIFRVIEVTHR